MPVWFDDAMGSLGEFFARGFAPVLLDFVDIFLVAAVIYWGLLLLKGTRAMQMALGLILVFVAYLAAQRLGLITIWSLLDSLVTYLVIIVVIIFQADIRRGLMRVGSQSLFRGQRTARETVVIEEIIKAATQLAQKRIGALVVFERSAELDEFIESGTTLDAAVTKELLYTIFIPSFENPMHDGAVVIRDGRIWQAGAFLPLAGTAGRDRTLGARHRAALGITEETDAVVVVVSEEKGAVSLCFGGNIVRGLDGQALRDALFGLFYRPKEKEPREKTDDRISVLADPTEGEGELESAADG
ncbi:MAG: diadenylate cyclase CdaA [Myxococcota bacterium]